MAQEDLAATQLGDKTHEQLCTSHSRDQTQDQPSLQTEESVIITSLKRTLRECDTACKNSDARVAALEQLLTMEKREHQLTTSKLSQLLKKRVSPSSMDMEREIQILRKQVSLLQQQQLLAKEHEEKLRQQLAVSIAQCAWTCMPT